MTYTILEISEEDFGCEGRPEGYEPLDTVRMRDTNGIETIKKISDARLYELDINVGDMISFDITEEIHKVY